MNSRNNTIVGNDLGETLFKYAVSEKDGKLSISATEVDILQK